MYSKLVHLKIALKIVTEWKYMPGDNEIDNVKAFFNGIIDKETIIYVLDKYEHNTIDDLNNKISIFHGK